MGVGSQARVVAQSAELLARVRMQRVMDGRQEETRNQTWISSRRKERAMAGSRRPVALVPNSVREGSEKVITKVALVKCG